MRVAWVFVLAAWLAGLPVTYVISAAPPGSESGSRPTGLPKFHDGEFVFVPTPTPEPDNPLFYRGSFQTSAPVAATAGAPAATATASTSASPVPTAAAPVATVTLPPPATRQAFTIASAARAPTVTPTPFVLGAEPDPRFHTGGFYLPPLTPNPIDEPDQYRGSVTADPGGVLALNAGGAAASAATPYAAMVPKGSGAGTSYETLRPTYAEQSPLPVQGRAMYYNPGIMAAVYAYRLQNQEIKPCPECVGYVALLRAGDLNRRVWLRWEDGVIEGPFLVIDVAARQHIALLLSRNWVVDVDYQTALRRNMNCPMAVTVLAGPPAFTVDTYDFREEVASR